MTTSNITFPRSSLTKIKWTTFSDGTESCKIDIPLGELDNYNHIHVNIEDATRDLIRIGLVKDALDNLGVENITLDIPYFPQARADRIFEEGNPLPVKLFAGILNSFNFKKVTIHDPHSDVTPALINNCEVVKQQTALKNYLPQIKRDFSDDFTLCAPDLGATKKTFDNMVSLGHDKYYQAIKVRDVKTGKIVKCDLLEDKIDGDVLIVDDICDYGGSFIHLADKLKERGARKVGLYVTHCIMKNGLASFHNSSIDYLMVSNIVGGYINNENIWRFNEY